MRADGPRARLTIRHLAHRKGETPIVALSAYSAVMARIFDPYCDFLLVGDSLGMSVYGLATTLGVTVEMMVAHGQAVMRGSREACVIVDLPFGSYQQSPEQAFATASHVMAETGCSAVKLEGGVVMADTIAFLVARGIPVLGHIGIKPQSTHVQGGYRVQGRSERDASLLTTDAQAIESAGAFAVVIEGTTERLARDLTGQLRIPTIGIGASAACDGQILIADEMIGLCPELKASFAKRYTELGSMAEAAVANYAAEVRGRVFPSAEHVFQERSDVGRSVER